MAHTKRYGQFFTPEEVAQTLVRWAVRRRKDRILDPSCGDGEFLVRHPYSVGIEIDVKHAATARERAPASLVHESDFFAWAEQTHERFDAVVGNPPFIRYQGFAGDMRTRALKLAKRIGADLSQLSSSWAPFIAGAATLLRQGGRLSFVVPAEIGHATYAIPLIRALAKSFARLHIAAIREKVFRNLSEDAWLLFADGFGGATHNIELSVLDRFEASSDPPRPLHRVSLEAWERSRGRLRRWLLPEEVLTLYETLEESDQTYRLGSIADVGIGYVTGANDFFHLRPSVTRALGVPPELLKVTVRKGELLPPASNLTRQHVRNWLENDEPVLLLHLEGKKSLPKSVRNYLTSPAGRVAQQAYKCRIRDPWYVVPNVTVPDAFLTSMSGESAQLVRNGTSCVATNSVHVVSLRNKRSFLSMQQAWGKTLTRLSCELEGHPLGGGMLKIEPREAQRILLPKPGLGNDSLVERLLNEGVRTMRKWRHCSK
jgi:SAM-dependent methyltransferase